MIAAQVIGWLTGAGIVVGLVLLAGILAGQFRRGVVEELRQTLATAKTEIDIERARSDRLEREAQKLREEVAALRAEVKTLRSVLTDGGAHAADEIKEAIGMSTARIMERIDSLEGAA